MLLNYFRKIFIENKKSCQTFLTVFSILDKKFPKIDY